VDTFYITFSVKNIVYTAGVRQTGNQYQVEIQDKLIAKIIGKMVLELQPDGKFQFNFRNSLQMDFVLAVATALKDHFEK